MIKTTLAAALVAALGMAAPAGATTLTFDDIGIVGQTTLTGFVEKGFKFSSNMDVIDVSSTGGTWSYGVNGGHSGKFAALNDYYGDMVMTVLGGGLFSVQDLWINGWQGGSTTSTISGWLNGVQVSSVSVSYSSPWKDVVLNFAGIDSLRISGGVFLVDDITVNGNVPEPGSVALLGLGLMGLYASRRKSKKV